MAKFRLKHGKLAARPGVRVGDVVELDMKEPYPDSLELVADAPAEKQSGKFMEAKP